MSAHINPLLDKNGPPRPLSISSDTCACASPATPKDVNYEEQGWRGLEKTTNNAAVLDGSSGLEEGSTFGNWCV